MNEQKPTKDTKTELGSATRSPSLPSRASVSSPQLLLFADVLPNGSGGFTVRPHKPEEEVSTAQAAKILGVSRAQMFYLRDNPVASKILQWRFTTPGNGGSGKKIRWKSASLIAYLEASRSWGK